ncbi:FHA domain-containing protein [Zafaria sp. Z1313]|uniref:FHA domain-containing protein n=1 Tax=unclassified Zafaria TaxID=2828765 RepID=UPI002E77BAD6|nr:FHA domain-containing protein [Zafaria sp. J156]MEE1620004.1 FHA domain-containing protein [Zafaria sp. J156]
MSLSIRYEPGEWIALVRSRLAVLLPPATSAEEVERLWAALDGGSSVESMLSTVLSGNGLSLTGMPPFGLLDFSEDVHVILRGPLSLTASGPELSTHVNGLGVTTWMERRIKGQERLGLAVDDGGRVVSTEASGLRLVEGVVRFGRLSAELPVACEEAVIEPLAREPGAGVAAASDAGAADEGEADGGEAAVARPVAEPVDAGEPKFDADEASGLEGPGADAQDPEAPAAEEPEEPAPDVRDPEAMGALALEVPAEPAPDARDPEATEEPAEPAPDAREQEAPEVLAPGKPAAAAAAESGEPEETEPDAAGTGTGEAGTSEDTTAFPGHDDDLAALGDTIITAEDAEEEHTIYSPSAAVAALASAHAVPEPTGGAGEPPAAEPAATPEPLPTVDDLIDSVPWLAAARDAGRLIEHGATGAAGGAPDDPAATGEPAPPAPSGAGQASSGVPAATDGLGDHDGQTLMRSDLPPAPAAQVGGVPGLPAAAPAAPPATGTGPQVLARLCPAGHANPPTATACTRCGEDLPGEAVPAPRPSLGRMVLSTGESVQLDRSAVVGRQPSITRSASGTMPRVVQVKSPGGDISRSHLEVRLEGWHVMLVDLEATNGTVLVRPGQAPQRLGKGESVMLLDGDVADLGDGVSLRFEGLL